MKRILIVLMLLLSSVSASYAASEDMSVYVRQDVFDAKMEKFMAEIKLMNGETLSEIRSLNSRMDSLEKRMSSLEVMIYWVLGTLGVAFAALALSPYLNNLRKQSLTIDMVNDLIAEALSNRTPQVS